MIADANRSVALSELFLPALEEAEFNSAYIEEGGDASAWMGGWNFCACKRN